LLEETKSWSINWLVCASSCASFWAISKYTCHSAASACAERSLALHKSHSISVSSPCLAWLLKLVIVEKRTFGDWSYYDQQTDYSYLQEPHPSVSFWIAGKGSNNQSNTKEQLDEVSIKMIEKDDVL
jgi:hypothetical protein